ncbi:hypothetical protein C0J52_19236 [Blattella germanica]|nr:hypothetical protein C0J52_19236 [Blattella germanica]
MSTCVEIVKHYRNLPDQHVEDLWNKIYVKGVQGELLRDILMFYFQHKMFPWPMQKSFDSLVVTFSAKGTSKKMRIVIFQILEEICSSLESSIVETLSFSANSSATVELLNCVLVGGFIPLLDKSAMEKLLNLLSGQVLTADESGKLLFFLCKVGSRNQSVLPQNFVSRLNQQILVWLQTSSITSSQLQTNTYSVTEVDGSPAGENFSILSLASPFSKSQIMNVHVFSLMKIWLNEAVGLEESELEPLIEAVRDYCTILVEQCFRTALLEYDAALQKAVLCEVLDILHLLVQYDSNQGPQVLQVVKRIQSNVFEKFKSDNRDVSVLVKVLNFFLNFGKVTGYNPQHFCNNFFKDIVYRSYSLEMAAFDIVIFLLDNRNNGSAMQQLLQLNQKFFPNLLKMIAFHPTYFLEEFIELVPTFVCQTTTVEVFHSLLDLPVLTATLCLHQAPVVLQLDNTNNSRGPKWQVLLENVNSPEFSPMFNFMLRMESGKGDTFDSKLCSHELLMKYYETLECVVYETFTVITTQENDVTFKLLNITSATLAKLASRCQDLIPRVMLCLRKIGAHMSKGLPNANKSDKKIVYDRVEELVCLLKNPKLSGSSIGD